jgi:hypothetical protein
MESSTERFKVSVEWVATVLSDLVTTLPQEKGWGGSRLAVICRDERRALLTLDLDFADIRAYPPAEIPGLIVFRLSRLDKAHVLQVATRLLALLERELLEGRLWIVGEERVRVRE